MDISDLHDKDFKIMVIKILLSTEECLNKVETSTQRQNIRKYYTELKNTIMEMENRFSNRLDKEVKKISEFEDKAMELAQSAQEKKKMKKVKIA